MLTDTNQLGYAISRQSVGRPTGSRFNTSHKRAARAILNGHSSIALRILFIGLIRFAVGVKPLGRIEVDR